jgi:hypothetical protein
MEPVSARTSQSIDSGIGSEEDTLTVDTQMPSFSTEAQFPQDSASISSMAFSLSTFSPTELRSLITDPARRATRIKELAELLRTLISLGECQLHPVLCSEFTLLLDRICGERVRLYNHPAVPNQPIRFKDAVGRKFSFPWDICKTWKVRLGIF